MCTAYVAPDDATTVPSTTGPTDAATTDVAADTDADSGLQCKSLPSVVSVTGNDEVDEMYRSKTRSDGHLHCC